VDEFSRGNQICSRPDLASGLINVNEIFSDASTVNEMTHDVGVTHDVGAPYAESTANLDKATP
jgi:hypothetical protein